MSTQNRHPSDDRLRDVADGRASLTTQELAAILVEVADQRIIQRLIAATVVAKRRIAAAKATETTARIISFPPNDLAHHPFS